MQKEEMASATDPVKNTETKIENKAQNNLLPTPDKNAKWEITVKDNLLRICPGKKWSSTIVLYPTANKESKHLLQPDFSNVLYIRASTAAVDIDSNKYEVVVEKYTASEPSAKMPFFLTLRFNPEFIIFGDVEDSLNWYIYRNHRLLSYEPKSFF